MPKKKKSSKPLFCGKCGRITFAHADDYKWWLVGTEYGTDVIRCPQHITTWTLRASGKGRHMANYRWAREAREQDDYDPKMMALEPLFLEEDL